MRRAVGVAGELFVTVGIIMLLFVVWQLGYVGIVDTRAQSGIVEGLERDFGTPTSTAHPSTPAAGGRLASAGGGTGPQTAGGGAPAEAGGTTLADGSVFAIVRIPRLGGPSWARPVLQGVGPDTLARGLGHYPQTQLPGHVGNVAIAGHRAGHGNPLIDIDQIKPGDLMIIETREGWFVYRTLSTEIVSPTRVDVLDPVPMQPGVSPTQSWFTLTSCDPKYGSTNRYIIISQLEQTFPRAHGLPPDLLADPASRA